MQYGYLIGIIWGLYFKKSIAFILLIIFLLYIIVLKYLKKYKLVKYLKIFLNKKYILIITISALISNTYILFLNYKYNKFYERPPDEIQAQAIIIRKL